MPGFPASILHALGENLVGQSEMGENPYESPKVEQSPPQRTRKKRRRSIGLQILLVNSVLVLLFPPTCCPCGFGPIGFLVQPYLVLLGFPTILVGFIVPNAVSEHPGLFLVAYLVNMVVVSYLMGRLVSLFFGSSRQVPDGDTSK